MQPGWTSYLISAYYPLLMTCASLVVCLWAEVSLIFFFKSLTLITIDDSRKWFCNCTKKKHRKLLRYGLFFVFVFKMFEIFTRLNSC